MAGSQGPARGRRARRAKGAAGAARGAALLVGGLLALVSPWRPGASSDGITVFRTAAALAFEGTFVLPEAPPGATLDPFYFRTAVGGSGVVALYAPFGPLLGAAVLRVAALAPTPALRGGLADVLSSGAPILAMALAVFPLALLVRHGGARRKAASWLASALVLGTFLGPLGTSDFQEPWLVLFVAIALERALGSRLLRGRAREGTLAMAGAALALAVLAKPTAVALLPALAIPALVPRRGELRGRGLLALALGATPGVALGLSLNAVRFGSAFATGYETPLAHPLARAVSPAWTVLRLTFLPNRGLAWSAPILLLAPFVAATLLARRRRAVLAASVLGFGAFFATNVSWFSWESGFGWGPRLLAPAVACAAPLLAARGPALRLAAALALLGILVNAPAYLLEPGRLYRAAVAAPTGEPLGPVVPIHREGAGTGRLAPLQRTHYVPSLAPVFLGPGLLRDRLFGDGSAGVPDGRRSRDAAILRWILREPKGTGSETALMLLMEESVTAPVDGPRARRMAARAEQFGAATSTVPLAPDRPGSGP